MQMETADAVSQRRDSAAIARRGGYIDPPPKVAENAIRKRLEVGRSDRAAAAGNARGALRSRWRSLNRLLGLAPTRAGSRRCTITKGASRRGRVAMEGGGSLGHDEADSSFPTGPPAASIPTDVPRGEPIPASDGGTGPPSASIPAQGGSWTRRSLLACRVRNCGGEGRPASPATRVVSSFAASAVEASRARSISVCAGRRAGASPGLPARGAVR
jgi:hypothetical protein